MKLVCIHGMCLIIIVMNHSYIYQRASTSDEMNILARDFKVQNRIGYRVFFIRDLCPICRSLRSSMISVLFLVTVLVTVLSLQLNSH